MNLRIKIISKLISLNEAIFFYPCLKRKYKQIFAKQKNLNIVDVGCNKGQSIDFFKDICKNINVIAYKPNRKLFEFLLKKYSTFPNIKIINKGVSDINGQLEFNENILDETSSFANVNIKSLHLIKKAKILGKSINELIINKYNVEVCTLANELKKRTYTIDVLKIDVKGHEYEVLKGLFNQSIN